MTHLKAIIRIALGAILFATPSAHAVEIGVGFGPFLPNRIGGVREVMNGWASRLSFDSSLGCFEIEYFNAHGDGANYHTATFDYRLDVKGEGGLSDLPVFLILGLHADSYSPTDIPTYKTMGGWHYGGGFRVPLSDKSPFSLRADFKQRFSPGNSLIVLIGFTYLTGSSSQEKR